MSIVTYLYRYAVPRFALRVIIKYFVACYTLHTIVTCASKRLHVYTCIVTIIRHCKYTIRSCDVNEQYTTLRRF